MVEKGVKREGFWQLDGVEVTLVSCELRAFCKKCQRVGVSNWRAWKSERDQVHWIWVSLFQLNSKLLPVNIYMLLVLVKHQSQSMPHLSDGNCFLQKHQHNQASANVFDSQELWKAFLISYFGMWEKVSQATKKGYHCHAIVPTLSLERLHW